MKMKKNCELCEGLAWMHCESDQASLCWSCDFKVHSANFLVARHSRTLLCHVCQTPTPWTAAGSKLVPTISVCDGCVNNFDKINHENYSGAANDNEGNETEVESGNIDEDDEYVADEEEEDDNEEEDEEEAEKDEDEDIDNQVVPWSPSAPPPPSAASSSSNSEEESYLSSSSSSSQRQRRKRTLENISDLRINVNRSCTNFQENSNAPPATVVEGGEGGGVGSVTSVVDSLIPPLEEEKRLKLKRRKIETGRAGLSFSRSWAIIESVKGSHRHEIRSSAAISKLCKLSEDPSAVDYDSSESS